MQPFVLVFAGLTAIHPSPIQTKRQGMPVLVVPADALIDEIVVVAPASPPLNVVAEKIVSSDAGVDVTTKGLVSDMSLEKPIQPFQKDDERIINSVLAANRN